MRRTYESDTEGITVLRKKVHFFVSLDSVLYLPRKRSKY